MWNLKLQKTGVFHGYFLLFVPVFIRFFSFSIFISLVTTTAGIASTRGVSVAATANSVLVFFILRLNILFICIYLILFFLCFYPLMIVAIVSCGKEDSDGRWRHDIKRGTRR